MFNKLIPKIYDEYKTSKTPDVETRDIFADILKNKDVHLLDKDTAHVLVSGNDLVSMRDVPGLTVKVKESKRSIHIVVRVADGTTIKNPVHMCVGLLSEDDVPKQEINVDLDVGKNCDLKIIAHCIFQSERVMHIMTGNINVGENSIFKYIEGHLHPEQGDITVKPTVNVNLEAGAQFTSDFQLLEGRAGDLGVVYDAKCAKNSVIDMTVRVSSKLDDCVRIVENGYLNGEGARAIIKSKISARDDADCEVRNTLIARAKNTRGHVDCQEVLKDRGSVTAIPMIKALHPLSQITHEASLGRVNDKQLETLLSKGLDEDEATELIIKGMLEM